MKISVIVRTNNEEANLERFVRSYVKWVDHILVQDDESKDIQYLFDTVFKYPKVQLDFYDGDRIVAGNITRAYHHIQLNSMIEWAEAIGSDWIIMDDCDCFPNESLKKDARKLMSTTTKDFIYAIKVHVYKNKGYLSKMSRKDGRWLQNIWAWRANKGFKFIDNGVHGQRFDLIDEDKKDYIPTPYATLHHGWPDDETIELKRTRYTAIYGDEYKDFHPLNFGGSIVELPEWAKE